jgi:hypothetical protein
MKISTLITPFMVTLSLFSLSLTMPKQAEAKLVGQRLNIPMLRRYCWNKYGDSQVTRYNGRHACSAQNSVIDYSAVCRDIFGGGSYLRGVYCVYDDSNRPRND